MPGRGACEGAASWVNTTSPSRSAACSVTPLITRPSAASSRSAPAPDGRRIAVIGAGPAGPAAPASWQRGHDVTVFEKDEPPGGLSTYGIVVMREPIRVSLEEVEFIRSPE